MDNAPFGSLPGELRTQIYELVLCNEPQEIVVSLAEPGTRTKKSTQPIALTQVCQQMRKDTLKLWYFTKSLVFLMTAFRECDTSHIAAPIDMYDSPLRRTVLETVNRVIFPPRLSTNAFQTWLKIADHEAVMDTRNVAIHFKTRLPIERDWANLALDVERATRILETFGPDTVIELHVTVEVHTCDRVWHVEPTAWDQTCDPVLIGQTKHAACVKREFDVIWTMGDSLAKWDEQLEESFRRFRGYGIGGLEHNSYCHYVWMRSESHWAKEFMRTGMPAIHGLRPST